MAASPIGAAQAGKSNQLLFVASSTAPNMDGRWRNGAAELIDAICTFFRTKGLA